MEYLTSIFSMVAGSPEQARWLLSMSIGIAAALLVMSMLLILFNVFNPFQRRLQAVSGLDSVSMNRGSELSKLIEPISEYVLPSKAEEQFSVRSRLIQAGYRSDYALATFYACKIIFAIALIFTVIFVATFFPKFTTLQVLVAAVYTGGIGMFLPNIFLSRRIEARQRLVINGFPDALDLLLTCTEAGLGLNAALQRVADELMVSHPVLAEELALVNIAIRAGVERTKALRDLVERTGVDDIRGLVSLLNQSLRFGTSVGDTLRVYAEEFRDKRMQRAEEQAAKIGTKMIFPLVFCCWPSFFLVAVGPAILSVMKVFDGLLAK